jgi:hypothetical protein
VTIIHKPIKPHSTINKIIKNPLYIFGYVLERHIVIWRFKIFKNVFRIVVKNTKYYWIYDKVFQIFCNSGKFCTQKKACSPSRFRVNGSTPYGKYKPAKHNIGIVP